MIESVRRMNGTQLASRALRRLRYRCLYPLAGRRLFPQNKSHDFSSDSTAMAGRVRPAPRTHVETALHEAFALCDHRFTFLNFPQEDLGNPVDWCSTAGGDPLWNYILHYGEWAETLAQAYHASGDTRFRDNLMRLIEDWIDRNPVGGGPGWDPYPISRRLVAWSRVGLSLSDDVVWSSFWKNRLGPSLHQQTRVLAANLEQDLSNNHLLANYRALACVGLLFPSWPGAARWQTLGLEGLWSEMRRQILSDGVHDERSVSYHALVLEDLFETWALCQAGGVAIPADVPETLRRMCHFLDAIECPDGSYPMWNDSVPGYPGNVRETVSRVKDALGVAEPAGSDVHATSAFPDAGYVVLRGGDGDCLSFDAGPMGPRHLPGHGHADTLGVVLYGRGHPLIVDPGVYSYHDRAWRDRFRSTRAHSTVEIDGVDHCVFWGNFRVAYPPDARLLEYSSDSAVGEHQGYRRLSEPVTHRRRIQRLGPSQWELTDTFAGSGTHNFLMSFQLAPGASATTDAGCVQARWPGRATLGISWPALPTGASVAIEDGWVSPGWYQKVKAPRIAVRWRSAVPCEMRVRLESGADG